MEPLRRCAVLVLLLLAAACGNAGPEPDQVLSAAGAAAEEAPPPPTSTTVAPTTIAPAPTTTRPAPATTATTAKRTQTSKVPVTPAPTIAGYAPAPPPPGVEPDGYGGYGGVTTVSANGLTMELHVYAREQYFGSPTQVWVDVAHPLGVAVIAITIDYGNGHVVTATPLARWACNSPDDAPASANYTYPVAGHFRVTATATTLPCMALPESPAGWGPVGAGPFVTTPPQTVSAGIDVLQRADAPPRPVGPPPGP